MRRLLLLTWMFAVLFGGLIFAAGVSEEAVEEPEPIALYVAGIDINDEGLLASVVHSFRDAHPDVELVYVPVNVQGATTITMDGRIEADLPVHIYDDYYSRVGKYTNHPRLKALDLSRAMSKADLDAFLPGVLDPYWIDGKLTAVPLPQMVVGMEINLTVLDKAGYKLPPIKDWTIAEFVKMCAAVKRANIPDTWGSMMFAENRSGDFHYMGWFASFGAQLFADGYDHTTVNSPEGLKVFEFWKYLQENGYIPEEAAILNDDHIIAARTAGQLAAAGARLGWYDSPAFQQSLVDQGIISEPYKAVFYPYPKGSGVDSVPYLSTYNLVVAFDCGDEAINALSLELAGHISNAHGQSLLASVGKKIPSRSGVDVVFAPGEESGWWHEAKARIEAAGFFDVGGSLVCYNDIRACLFPELQRLFTGAATPAEALAGYEARLNAVLATLE